MAGMSGSPDTSTEERLLTGHMDPADAPPGFRQVARLLGDAGTIPPAADDDEPMLRAMVAAIASGAAAQTSAGFPERRRSRRLAQVFLAAATMATLATGGVAAASGNLPDPIQNAVSNAAGIVGVDIPRGKAYGHLDKADKDAVREADRSGRAGQMPGDAGRPDDRGRGSEVADTAQDPALEGAERGACVSEVASAGKGRSGEQHDVTCRAGGESPEGTSGEDTRPEPRTDKGGRPEITPADPGQGPSVSEDRARQAPADQGAPEDIATPDRGAPDDLPAHQNVPAPEGGRP